MYIHVYFSTYNSHSLLYFYSNEIYYNFLIKLIKKFVVHIKLNWLFYLSNTNDLSTWMINNIFYDSLKKAVIIRTDGLIKLTFSKVILYFYVFYIIILSVLFEVSFITNYYTNTN